MHTPSSRRTILCAFALAVGLSGCATAGGGASSDGPRGTANRIIMDELVGIEQYDAYQAIQRLRPQWLQSRGGSDPLVHIDGTRRGGLGELRSVRAADIQQMEFMSASDASTRFGTGYQGGAILVTTRR